jgi:hypothetical protein
LEASEKNMGNRGSKSVTVLSLSHLLSEVGEALGVPTGSIRMYFSRNTQKPYKGRYLLQKLKKV